MTLSPTIADDLTANPWNYDFFRAVQIIDAIDNAHGEFATQASWEQLSTIRFHAPATTAFPPSAISDLRLSEGDEFQWDMEVNFLGLTGPSGVMPRHYTEMVMDLSRHGQGSSSKALRDWLDRFNNRLVKLFYLAWEKYRFSAQVMRRPEQAKHSDDPFSHVLRSVVGIGLKSQKDRMLFPNKGSKQSGAATYKVGWPLLEKSSVTSPTKEHTQGVNDLALLHYGGLVAPRRRSAKSVAQVLGDYFQLPLEVLSFQGQWLYLEKQDRTRLGTSSACSQYNQLGGQAVVGERVWDLQSKFRVKLGPLTYKQFQDFLPTTGSGLVALAEFSKVLAGPTLDFDLQLILRREEVPRTQLAAAQPNSGVARSPSRLGYNTWLTSSEADTDKADLVISSEAR